MASRADVDRELLPRRTRLESASAGAGGGGGLVFGVNAVLHGSLSIRWGSAGAGRAEPSSAPEEEQAPPGIEVAHGPSRGVVLQRVLVAPKGGKLRSPVS